MEPSLFIYVMVLFAMSFCCFIFLARRLAALNDGLVKRLKSIEEALGRLEKSDGQKSRGETRKCPFCAETILKDAMLCKFCKNRILSDSHDTPAPHPGRHPSGKGISEIKELSETETVNLLLSSAPDVNLQDTIGFTQLHTAVYKGNSEAVEQLISKGADVNKMDRFGRTPLHWAACKGRSEIAKVLLSKSADVNAKHTGGWTPLHVGAWYGTAEVVKLLLDSGADVNAKNNDGNTALRLAIENAHRDIVTILKERGAAE